VLVYTFGSSALTSFFSSSSFISTLAPTFGCSAFSSGYAGSFTSSFDSVGSCFGNCIAGETASATSCTSCLTGEALAEFCFSSSYYSLKHLEQRKLVFYVP